MSTLDQMFQCNVRTPKANDALKYVTHVISVGSFGPFSNFFLTSEKFPSFENLMNIVDDDGMCCSRWSFRTAWSAEMKVTCLYVGKSHSKFITRITSVMTHLASSTATDSFWAWTPRDSVFANDFQGFKNIHLTYNLYAITRLNSDNFSRFRMRGNIIFSLSSYDRTRENIQKNPFFSRIFLNILE